MKNTPKLLAGLVALTPLFLTTFAAQAHNGVKHPAKHHVATKHHVHGKSDKPHAVKSNSKSGSKMSGMKMTGGKMSGMKMSGMKMSGKK